MAALSPPLAVDDDDNDDFDWEAAVREIDTACAIASTSTATSHQPDPPAAPAAAEARPNLAGTGGRSRQSTLDRFVDSYSRNSKDRGKSPVTDTPAVDRGGGDNLDGLEGAAGVEIDLEAAKTWIYPVNVPLRDYQFSISRTALFSNTLVALPTGLGKTLIAAVVMYNYFRWFPEGAVAKLNCHTSTVVVGIEETVLRNPAEAMVLPALWKGFKSTVLKANTGN